MADQEPLFRRRPLDHWLRLRCSGDDEERWEAIDAIRHLCAPDQSIPLCLETLRWDAYWRARCLAAHALYDMAFHTEFHARLLETVPVLRDALVDSSELVREQVHELLVLLGQAEAE